jgi:hypothetical protein
MTLLSLPPGPRALADLCTFLCTLPGAVLGALTGALLNWPLGGVEVAIGASAPLVIISGGTRLLWAAYMLMTAFVFWIIAQVTR